MLNKRRFANAQSLGQLLNCGCLDAPYCSQVFADKLSGHKQIGSESVGPLLDSRCGPRAGDMDDAASTGTIEQNMAEFMRDSKASAVLGPVEHATRIRHDQRPKVLAG